MNTDKTVADLMALADKYAEAKAQVAVYGFSDVQKRRATLEQAIRRAVDWEQVAWQERQARRVNKATGNVTEWSGWYECKPRKLTDPLAYTDPDDMIPREWRPLYARNKP